MRFLHFDLKTERRRNLVHDKFALASKLWNNFISNCQKAFVPQWNITVDEQLLPCKTSCKFILYMANKPDKFGIKFWLAVDVENKYLFNGFSYVGNDDTRDPDVSVPSDVVLKLMAPVFQAGYNVTCDNFFTSLIWHCDLQRRSVALLEHCARTGKKSQKNARKSICTKQKILGMTAKRQLHSLPTNAKQQKIC